jgi:hypothetical protein
MILWLYDILVVSGTTGMIAGAGLLLMPERAFGEQSRWRQWLLEHDLATQLNLYQKIEKPLYRHHRLVGAALTVGALALLTLMAKLQSYLFATSVWNQIQGVRLAMLFAWALAILALIIGIFFLVRPSALKGVETLSNRWIGPPPSTFQQAEPAKGINRLILRFPRRTGILLLLAGITCLGVAARMAAA